MLREDKSVISDQLSSSLLNLYLLSLKTKTYALSTEWTKRIWMEFSTWLAPRRSTPWLNCAFSVLQPKKQQKNSWRPCEGADAICWLFITTPRGRQGYEMMSNLGYTMGWCSYTSSLMTAMIISAGWRITEEELTCRAWQSKQRWNWAANKLRRRKTNIRLRVCESGTGEKTLSRLWAGRSVPLRWTRLHQWKGFRPDDNVLCDPEGLAALRPSDTHINPSQAVWTGA